jgi:3-oxoadipate enol-lactonase
MPEPPVELPPGRIVHVPGRGEFFVRDSGGQGPPILLLHGWMFQSDLNWFRIYAPLIDAGYRVLAIDHRGHGRGLRTPAPFRLTDCAADAAALIERLGCGPLTVVGYSMGGPIAQLMTRDHPDTVRALVLCATAPDWTERHMRRLWRSMAALRLALNLFPTSAWRGVLRAAGLKDSPTTTWIAAELSRGSSRDIAEAGRELGRFDSRPWVAALDAPAAVVVTAHDRSVPPRKQRELAGLLGARRFEDAGDHDAVVAHGPRFAAILLEALAAVSQETAARAA